MWCALVYRDVENIEPLTKEDMLDFYRTHFAPSSSTRSKAAIHMVAQASASDIAKKIDPVEQRTKLATTLASVLSQLGLQADPAKLAVKLEDVDVAGGDVDGIMSAAGKFLKADAGNSAEKVDAAMEQAPAVLKQILPTLGIKAKGEEVVEDGANGVPEKTSKTVVIEDVKAWKAGLPLSAGPKAVKALSEFEELESKL